MDNSGWQQYCFCWTVTGWTACRRTFKGRPSCRAGAIGAGVGVGSRSRGSGVRSEKLNVSK